MKPMLAATLDDVNALDYSLGLIVSPKLDGVRAIVINAVVMSRSLKPIRNRHVQNLFGRPELNGLDGELIVNEPTARDCYRVTSSGVMSEDGEPNVTYYVFDKFDASGGFKQRFASLPHDSEKIKRVPHHVITTKQQLLDLEEKYLNEGYEGLMIRHPYGPFKQGRSTLKEGYLLKLKRFSDAEYEVVGFQERMHNANEAKTNELGRTERSMHKENMIGRGDLGALVLKYESGTFNCGTGFTDEDRAEIWNNRDKYLGAFAKVKSFLIGVKDAPRFPVWLGFRDGDDK